MNSIITNAHVTVAANEFYDTLRYTVPDIIVFTDDVETARTNVVSAVESVFEGRTVTVTFEFEK